MSYHRAVVKAELMLALERFNSNINPVIVYQGTTYSDEETESFIARLLVQDSGTGTISFEPLVVEQDDGTATGKMYLHGIDSIMVAANEKAVFEISFAITHDKKNYILEIHSADFIGGEVDTYADIEPLAVASNEFAGIFSGHMQPALLADIITILDRGGRTYLSSAWVDTVVPVVEASSKDVLEYFGALSKTSSPDAYIEGMLWRANLNRRTVLTPFTGHHKDLLHDVDLLVYVGDEYALWTGYWNQSTGLSSSIDVAKARYAFLVEHTKDKAMKTNIFSQFNELLKERFSAELRAIKAALIKAGVTADAMSKDTTVKPESSQINSNESVDPNNLKLLSIYELENSKVDRKVVICDTVGDTKMYHRCTITAVDEDCVDFFSESKDHFSCFRVNSNGHFAVYQSTLDSEPRVIEVFKEQENAPA